MRRTTAAFLIAPLWVPAIVGIYTIRMFPYPEQNHWIFITAIIGGIFGYAGTFAFGVPIFVFLRSRRLTSIWIAIVLGFAAGGITWMIFLFLFGLSLGNSLSFSTTETFHPSQWVFALIPAALGALVGATLWLIARPDRLPEH